MWTDQRILQILLGRFGGDDYGEKSVQDLNEKFIDSLVRPTSRGFKIADFTIYCIDVNIRDGEGSKSIDIIPLDRDKCKVTSESKKIVCRKSIIMGRNNSQQST